ncbi:transmembrane protein (PGPGW) [Actinotalea ferrariae CF5-4]|uniref:Transmembrane protein (PGPGW) n=1 Tax=Actinotalea ferrariae CF5-4 TaxID=948458 RepID=A0A021VQW0_9CELL|nr:PGPGW domain-containing protein [Actinotalea ferrariae]EYR63589.1 transmembrane protein (PGPGW) [Actinotalea ferrariae CF5-4]
MGTVLVGVAGGALLLTGIALLVLPGPGFVLVAAGLAILATRFAWAERPLAYAKHKARQGVAEVRRSRLRAGASVGFALALVAIGLAQVLGADLPFMNLASAILMIGSGLVLVGTVVHARVTRGRHEADAPPRRHD